MRHPLIPEPAVITDIAPQARDTRTYTVRFRDPARRDGFSFRPGQFNMLSLLGIGEAAISLSSDPEDEGGFEHTVRAVGGVTKALARLEPGDTVWVRGPYGNPWPLESARGSDLLIVAGGIGLAPLRPVLTRVMARRGEYGRVELLYGARAPDDLLYTGEFDRWREQGEIDVLLTVDKVPEGRRWNGDVGVVTTLFPRSRIQPRHAVAFTCGPEVMMKFVVLDLLSRGFPPDRVYLSLERRVECGIRTCGRCQMGPLYVCQDGPVFSYEEVRDLFGRTV